MPGTKAGGAKAAITNKERHGSDFYKKIGSKGGKNGNTGGFAANRELARIAGRKGGQISKRRKNAEIREAQAAKDREVLLAARQAQADREANISASAEEEGSGPGFLRNVLRSRKR